MSHARPPVAAAPDMSRTFTMGVVIYVLFFIILDHGYLQKEQPFVGMDFSLSLVRA